MILFLITLGLIVIVALAAYALRLNALVKKQKYIDQIEQTKADKKRQAQIQYILESLRVISANVIDEGLNLSEATLRCKPLLDGLLLSESERQPFEILDVVHEQIKEFDTHQARHKLSTSEREAQDVAREKIEQQYEVALKECFERLRNIDNPIRH